MVRRTARAGGFARDRPLAWIDDCLDDSCHSWAESRTAPTLLVPTEPFTGLTEELTEVEWLDADGGSHQATVTLSPGPPA